jgi:hypothetical protein
MFCIKVFYNYSGFDHEIGDLSIVVGPFKTEVTAKDLCVDVYRLTGKYRVAIEPLLSIHEFFVFLNEQKAKNPKLSLDGQIVEKCPICNGTGHDPTVTNRQGLPCIECYGTGKV